VHHGEVVGLIGRNGAGKSTLLKVLSRITEPTTGRIDIYGRVASLLEVGTGFHPDLTGRENAYLNGTILGMTKAEVDRKFDEIVAFSEIEKFIDTPVKRYSSGMKVRLAFSVAAHLEPEILLVDEVLAVGDVAFQKKCLGKMDDVAGEGRTVIFVSHHMNMIEALCERGIVLDGGQVSFDGGVDEAIGVYLSQMDAYADVDVADRTDREGDGSVRLRGLWFEDENGVQRTSFASGESMRICLDYEMLEETGKCDANLGLYDHLGRNVAYLSTAFDPATVNDALRPGRGLIVCEIPRLPLNSGDYSLNTSIRRNGQKADWIEAASHFYVEGGDFYGVGKTPNTKSGSFLLDYQWREREIAHTK
jgi:lipopolysaccharide transport system ATP-binding protein